MNNNEVVTKPAWQSKTLWMNVIGAALALFYPPANAYLVSHPDVVAGSFAVINIILRFITKGPIQITD